MRLLILVIAARSEIYDELIKRYWSKLAKLCEVSEKKFGHKVDLRLLFGNSSLEGLEIESGCLLQYRGIEEEFRPGIFQKTVRAFKELGPDYDVIFRTNLSSFLRLNMLLDYLNKQYRQHSSSLYSGQKIYYPWTIGKRVLMKECIPFASGCGFFVSRDVARLVVERSNTVTGMEYSDDVLIGSLLRDVKIRSNPRYTVIWEKEFLSNQKLKHILEKILVGRYFHVRVKNEADRQIDLQIIDYLVNRFYKI